MEMMDYVDENDNVLGQDSKENIKEKGLNYRVVYKELPEQRHRFPSSEIEEVLNWFRANKRHPYPKQIKFATESARYSTSYWVKITQFSELVGQVTGVGRDMGGQLTRPNAFPATASVMAEAKDGKNEIHLVTEGIKALRLYLDSGLIDMDNPLNVYINGTAVFSGKVTVSAQTILDTAKIRNDRDALFSAYLDLSVPTE